MPPTTTSTLLFTAASLTFGCGGHICSCEDCDEVLAEELGAFVADAREEEKLCILGDLIVEDELPPGLHRVQEIQGSLVVDGNTHLDRLDLWDGIQQVDGIIVTRSPNLQHISGGKGLVTIKRDLYIVDNAGLLDIELATEPLDVLGSIYVTHNPLLSSISLGSVESVKDNVLFAENAQLATIDTGRLRSIGGRFDIADNSSLNELRLEVLQDIGADFTIGRNESLASVDIPNLETSGALTLDENSALRTFSSQVIPEGSIRVRANPDLSEVRGGSLADSDQIWALFMDNSSLVSIEGFSDAERLLGLWVIRNASLRSLTWPRLREVSGLGFIAGGNAVLEAPPGALLPALTNSYNVAIYGNSALDPESIADLLDRVEVDDPATTKVGNNLGEETLLSPCPWENDIFCDQESSVCGEPGTGLCAEDEADCACL